MSINYQEKMPHNNLIFIKSPFTDVGFPLWRDQYTRRNEFNNGINVGKQRQKLKLTHPTQEKRATQVYMIKPRGKFVRKNRQNIYWTSYTFTRSYHEALFCFVLAMLRRSPKSLSSGFDGLMGCAMEDEEGAA